MNRQVLLLEEVTKIFPPSRRSGEALTAVSKVSFSLTAGEVFGLVGESGSGKSTLARCAFGITPISSGQVSILGQELKTVSTKKLRQLKSELGFVFQDPIGSLNPKLRVADIIAEPLELRKMPADEISARVSYLIERVGLTQNHLERKRHELSGGQCQRVAIARALATNPKLILLDEPTSSLDLSVQAQILNLLEELRREFNLTYLIISHNLDVISHMSDRMAVMKDGKIVEMGATQELLSNPTNSYTQELVDSYSSSYAREGKLPRDFNLDTWQDAPLNRWAFQNVDLFLPTRSILANPTALPLEHVEQARHYPEVANEIAELDTDALLVMNQGKIHYEKYWHGMTGDSRHLLQSVSKSILGGLYANLIADRKIDPSQKVFHYLPELSHSGFGDATIQNLLDMTAAVNFSEDYHDPASEIAQLDRSAGWRNRAPGKPVFIREFLGSVKKNGEHGTHFQYCSANTDLLAWLAEKVTGVAYENLLSSIIWQPLKAFENASITVDLEGSPLANGGISTTARDLARFGEAILNNGVVDGVQVIPSRWIAETFAGASPDVQSPQWMQDLHPGGSYRNQWWVTNSVRGEIYGVGIYGQYLWLDPTSHTVIVKFSSLPLATDAVHSVKHMQLFRHISSTFSNIR
ncbi:MAG: ATP-binding cassette domain-containing protein [Actinomycetes bacterium]